LQVPPPSSPRAQPCLFFRPCSFLRSSRPSHRVAVVVAVPVAAVAPTPACTRARSNAHQRACAPPHASPLGERQGRAFGSVDPCTEAVDPLAAPLRILPRGCISAHARRVKAEPLGSLARSCRRPGVRLWTPPAMGACFLPPP
jgi:hypothetical protein